MKKVISELPFSLTRGQLMAVEKISGNTKSGVLSDVLIQGDVGCGKTIVAFLLMILAAENGYQSVFMAPTQILASQHYEKLKVLVGEDQVCLLSGGLKKSEKKNIFNKIYSGEYLYIIGTQSIISNISDIPFSSLGLAIVDEEHKFGVEQRAALLNKGVHTIVMSATPIPRTFALAKYGEMLDIIQITDKPRNRKEVISYFNPIDQMSRLIDIIKNAARPVNPEYVRSQVYVVCPMIEETESEVMNGVYSVDEIYDLLNKNLSGDGICVKKVTGKTDAEEKNVILSGFENGEVDVLVSTTVVEVGVDVPNANLMVIMNAERFGLATMHQLRGRVGRGSVQGFCILSSKEPNNRINAILSTTDGFKIAELDAKERNFGNFTGVEQSGKNKITEEMFAYPQLNEISKKIVSALYEYKKVISNYENYYIR